jgi:hypothetical protein
MCGDRNFWRKRQLREYEAALAGLQTSEAQPDDDEFVNSAYVKKRYGGVSDMWIHRRLAKKSKPATDQAEREAANAA